MDLFKFRTSIVMSLDVPIFKSNRYIDISVLIF